MSKCLCITKTTGKQCKNNSTVNSQFCHLHINCKTSLNPTLQQNASQKLQQSASQKLQQSDKSKLQQSDKPKIQQVKIYDYIERPVNLTEHYSEKYQKHIYIFGDEHIVNPSCGQDVNKIDIDYFIRNTINSTKKFVDVFLETTFYRKDIQSIPIVTTGDPNIDKILADQQKMKLTSRNLSALALIEQTFHNCLTFDKSQCEYKNARFHYVDMRSHIKPSMNLIANIYKTSDVNAKYILFQNMYKFYKIDKQIDNIHNKDIKKLLNEYIENKYNEMMKIKDWNAFRQLFGVFLLVDVYLLARLFRTFQSTTCDNVIIYVGHVHAENYRKFLDTAGFQLINKVYNKPDPSYTYNLGPVEILGYQDQCIDIRKFHQPFFELPN